MVGCKAYKTITYEVDFCFYVSTQPDHPPLNPLPSREGKTWPPLPLRERVGVRGITRNCQQLLCQGANKLYQSCDILLRYSARMRIAHDCTAINNNNCACIRCSPVISEHLSGLINIELQVQPTRVILYPPNAKPLNRPGICKTINNRNKENVAAKTLIGWKDLQQLILKGLIDINGCSRFTGYNDNLTSKILRA